MLATTDWPAVLLHLPEASWTLTDGIPSTRIRVAGCTLTLTGLRVTTGDDDIQVAVDDPARETLLLDLYNPGDPWQTWHGFDAEYALYATPAADQDSPVAADVDVPRSAWSGFIADLEDVDRKLVSIVVAGHCALHLDARRVTGPDQEFAAYPEDRDALAALVGWSGPYPTVRIDDADFVLFAYPHGN